MRHFIPLTACYYLSHEGYYTCEHNHKSYESIKRISQRVAFSNCIPRIILRTSSLAIPLISQLCSFKTFSILKFFSEDG